MFGSGMGVDGGVLEVMLLVRGKRGEGQALQKTKTEGRGQCKEGVLHFFFFFCGRKWSVGSVTGQQKEQCPHGKGQKG